jgi:hypothetical protein
MVSQFPTMLVPGEIYLAVTGISNRCALTIRFREAVSNEILLEASIPDISQPDKLGTVERIVRRRVMITNVRYLLPALFSSGKL